jgi:hypothetical protein
MWTSNFLCPRIERSGAYSFWPVRPSVCPSVCLSVCKNFNIGHIFWMVSDRAFIFHMCVPYDKNFLLVPKFLTLWPWSLTHFSKSLTLAISFEWQVIGFSYFICVFLMTKPFYWYQHFWPCDLDLEVWPTFQNIGNIFWMASDRAFIFYMCVPYDKTFLLVPTFLTLWPWPWSLIHFSKTLTLAVSFEW